MSRRRSPARSCAALVLPAPSCRHRLRASSSSISVRIASLPYGSPDHHGAAVKWKLWTRNDTIGKGFDEYVSKDAALERARDIIRQPHVKFSTLKSRAVTGSN